MRKILLFLIFIGFNNVLHATFNINGGICAVYTLSTLQTDQPINKNQYCQETRLFVGGTWTHTVNNNQITLKLLPGALINLPLNPSLNNLVTTTANFIFYEAYFRVDSLATTYNVGKSTLDWGVGTLRQFAFIVNNPFQINLNYFYNMEMLYRHKATLVSMGIAMDTCSIDLFDKPQWYKPWLYVKYDDVNYTLLGTVIVDYTVGFGTDIKGAFDFQYFLPKNFQLYGTLAYLFLENNKIGGIDQLQLLLGLSYKFRYDSNIQLIPQIEYVLETSNNYLNIGTTAVLYQVDLSLFATIQYTPENSMITSLLSLVTWNLNQYFYLELEYQHFLYANSPLIEKPENFIQLTMSVIR